MTPPFPNGASAIGRFDRLRANDAMPKYVASRSLSEVTWNATLLGLDIVGAIEELKAQPGKDLIKYGTSRIDDTLLRAGLVEVTCETSDRRSAATRVTWIVAAAPGAREGNRHPNVRRGRARARSHRLGQR